jgi:hypothetical protein
VTWSAPYASFSQFGGYDGITFNVTAGPQQGEAQVYWGFLGDGYSVDLVGLKSLFTNSPFVVQLMASFNGGTNSTLTNAFILDATASTTQLVSYPNIPPAGAYGGSGGLSTVSGPLDTDHLRIMGNQAQSGKAPPGFYLASTLAGFILTDKPVTTMSPQSVVATAGDTIVLRAIAIGVPPLTYQWRKNGLPISGATNSTYMAPNIQIGGQFDLVVTNLYGATTSKVATVTVNGLNIGPQSALVADSKPQGSPRYGASSAVTWLPSSQDSAHNTLLGVMRFSAASGSQIVLPTAGTTNFDSPQGTIMFWMRSAATVAQNSTLEASTLFNRFVGSYVNGSGLALAQARTGTSAGAGNIQIYWAAAGEIPRNSSRSVSDNLWHHIALVYDQASNGPVQLYIDGTLDLVSSNLWSLTWPAGQQIELGRSHDNQWAHYDGLLDDFRIYGRSLTQSEIAEVISGNALVDTNALLVRWNFDTPPIPGVGMSWPANTAVLQSAATSRGPYTDLPSAASPLYLPMQPGQQFYRFRRASPMVISSNPFDM